jgi:hypothetical protein
MSAERAEFDKWFDGFPINRRNVSWDVWQAAYAAGKRAGDLELVEALRSTVMFVPPGHPLQERLSHLLALRVKDGE